MFDYDYSFRADRHCDRQSEPEPLVICDSCSGLGRHCDLWGPWDCGLCQGKGFVPRLAWLAYIATFPPHIRDFWLLREPPIFHLSHNGKD